MARIIVIQHVPYEPLGTIDEIIKRRGHRIRYVNFGRTPDKEINIDNYDALIVLGGPMNVDQSDKHPYLLHEIDVIKQMLGTDKPILGICLGAQLMAAAAGASVYPAPTKEVGWYCLEKTVEAETDPLIQHWQTKEHIFQWHGYTFDMPENALQLVTGEHCSNQAFRLGKKAYGFQFHLEVTEKLIQRWVSLANHAADMWEDRNKHQQHIREETERYIKQSLALSEKVFNAFLDLLPDVNRQVRLPSR